MPSDTLSRARRSCCTRWRSWDTLPTRLEAQAAALERILPLLSEEELAVYRRGRNTRVHSVPKNAEIGAYHAATGLECLFGWLYLSGRHARVNELFARITEEA